MAQRLRIEAVHSRMSKDTQMSQRIQPNSHFPEKTKYQLVIISGQNQNYAYNNVSSD